MLWVRGHFLQWDLFAEYTKLAATKTELFYDQNIYKEQLDDGDLSSIANEFVCGSEHRMHVFGKF